MSSIASVGGHVALDPGGRLWNVSEIGAGASYDDPAGRAKNRRVEAVIPD